MRQEFRFNKCHCVVHFSPRVTENWEDAILYYGFCSSAPIRIKFDREKKVLVLFDYLNIPERHDNELNYDNNKTLKFIKLSKENLLMLMDLSR